MLKELESKINLQLCQLCIKYHFMLSQHIFSIVQSFNKAVPLSDQFNDMENHSQCFSLSLHYFLYTHYYLVYTHGFSYYLCSNSVKSVLPVQLLIVPMTSFLLDMLLQMSHAHLQHMPNYTHLLSLLLPSKLQICFSSCAPDLKKQYHYVPMQSNIKLDHHMIPPPFLHPMDQ